MSETNSTEEYRGPDLNKYFYIENEENGYINGRYSKYFYFFYDPDEDSLSLEYDGVYDINFKSVCYFASEANIDTFILCVNQDLINVIENLAEEDDFSE